MGNGETLSVGYMNDPFDGFRPVEIPNMYRNIGFLGTTGCGKTTSARNLAIQVNQQFGFTYIDSKGEVNIRLKQQLSEEEFNEISVFELGVESQPSLNLFNQDGESSEIVIEFFIMLTELVSDTYYGSATDEILRKIVNGVIHSDKYDTLEDVYQVLQSKEERQVLIDSLENGRRKSDLERINEIHSEESFEPAQKRVSEMLNDTYLTDFLNDSDNVIDFQTLSSYVENNKSVIVDTSSLFESVVGEAYILALWNVITNRVHNGDEPIPHFLFIDELDDFNNNFVPTFLAKGRSFKFGVIFTCQNIQTLNEEVRNSVLGNCGNLFIMQIINKQNANTFANLFDSFGRNHFLNLKLFQFTASITNEYGEKVSITGKLFPEYQEINQ